MTQPHTRPIAEASKRVANRAVHRAAAMSGLERSMDWLIYQTRHPDWGTTSFMQAYRDFKDGIPIEDVCFARRIKK